MYSVSIHRNKLRYKNFIAKYICSFFPITLILMNSVFSHTLLMKTQQTLMCSSIIDIVNFLLTWNYCLWHLFWSTLLLLIRNNEQYLFIYLFIIFVAAFVYLDKVSLHRGRQFLLIVLFCYKKNLTLKYCMPFMKITFQVDLLINFLWSKYRLKIKVVW